MLSLPSLNYKKIVLTGLFCLTFVSLGDRVVNACSNLEKQRHILLEREPQRKNIAKFIGKIEVKDVRSGRIVAILLESKSHSHQVGNTITVVYNPNNLCGKKVEIGEIGYLVGDYREWKLEGRKYLSVQPHLINSDRSESNRENSQEQILIYCFNGDRDNNYVYMNGGHCSTNP